MAVEILIPNSPWSYQEVTLEAKTLKIELMWNTRATTKGEGNWFIDLYDINDELVLGGVKVVESINLFSRYLKDEVPQGAFVCVKVKDNAGILGRDNLGTDYKLFYITKEELANGTIQ